MIFKNSTNDSMIAFIILNMKIFINKSSFMWWYNPIFGPIILQILPSFEFSAIREQLQQKKLFNFSDYSPIWLSL